MIWVSEDPATVIMNVGCSVGIFLEDGRTPKDDCTQISIEKKNFVNRCSGGIGSALFRAEASNYFFRLADRETSTIVSALSQEHEIREFDVADLEACQEICRDIDIVIHLAAATNPEADFYQAFCITISAGPTTSFERQKIRDVNASSLPAARKSSPVIPTMSRFILSHQCVP